MDGKELEHRMCVPEKALTVAIQSDVGWDEAKGSDIATQCGVTLSARHWEVIRILRELYIAQNRHPSTRVFIKALHAPSSAASMLELMRLFGERPMRTLSKIAGLPEPPHCI